MDKAQFADAPEDKEFPDWDPNKEEEEDDEALSKEKEDVSKAGNQTAPAPQTAGEAATESTEPQQSKTADEATAESIDPTAGEGETEPTGPTAPSLRFKFNGLRQWSKIRVMLMIPCVQICTT